MFGGKPRDLFTEANFRKFERSWDDGRVATAFFRGESNYNAALTSCQIKKSYC